MKIYKFKDLRDKSKHSHLRQIIVKNKIWCAAPDSLNDSEEFNFQVDYNPTSATEKLLTQVIEKLGKSKLPPSLVASHALSEGLLKERAKPIVENIVQECRNSIGITSFSTVASDDKLWTEYGGEGNGAVVEFEISEGAIGNIYHWVDYDCERIIHIDVFLESQVNDVRAIYRSILCTKAKKWEGEEEIRFLGKNQNINFTLTDPITKVIFGDRVSAPLRNELLAHCNQQGIHVDYYNSPTE